MFGGRLQSVPREYVVLVSQQSLILPCRIGIAAEETLYTSPLHKSPMLGNPRLNNEM